MRSLTDREKELLTSTLELMRTGDHEILDLGEFAAPPEDPTPYLLQIPNLMVSSKCPCKQEECESVWFTEQYKGGNFYGVHPVAQTQIDSGQMVFVFAHDQTGELVELEVI